jgi:hypothetical protein
MTTYYSTNNLFSYTVTNNSSTYTLDSDDYTIIAAAFNKWDEILDKDPRFNTYTITVSVSVSTLDAGVLGGASLNTVYYFGTMNFGNTFPADGNITLSDSYLPSLKTAIHNDGNSSYYHVFLHELGHILGIGSLWDLTDFPKTAYVEDSQIKYYYTGEKALQEYKNYFPEYDNNNFVGIPFEDDGSSGTINVHPEEGSEGTTSSDDRYINGVFHPGLDTELMSGWLDSYPTNAPLSRITLGFLDDMGYVVDYSKADTYRGYSATSFNSGNFSNYSSYMSEWLSDSDNANLLLSTQFSNYVDISAGDIVLRNKNDEKLFVSGDISFNKNTTLGLTRDKLISREIDTFTYGGAVNSFDLDSSFNILGVNETDNVGKVIATNDSMNTIGIGYPMDNGEGTKRGKVKVYQIDTNKNIYRQLGQDITGTTDNEEFGHSLDINNDGTILAVGTKDVSYNTLVYKYDSGSWGLYGNRIYGHQPLYGQSYDIENTSQVIDFTNCAFSWDFRVDQTGGTIVDHISSCNLTMNSSTACTTGDGAYFNGQTSSSSSEVDFYLNGNTFYEFYIKWDSTADSTFYTGLNSNYTFRYKNNGMLWIDWNGADFLDRKFKTYTTDSNSSDSPYMHWCLSIGDSDADHKVWRNGVLMVNGANSGVDPTEWRMNYSGTYTDDLQSNNSISIGSGSTQSYMKFFRIWNNQTMDQTFVDNLYANRNAIYGQAITISTGIRYVPTTTLSTNVKLNKLGDKLAILTHFKNEATDLSGNGLIQSYQYSESDASWNYLGDKIESSALNDISGGTIDINADGDVIAIGYPNIDETGYVRVYNYDNSWNQIGSDITGSANEQFGKSLSLDLCGNNIAIGAPYAGDVSGGKIQVYTNNSNTWTQVGSDINIQTTASNDISMALLGNSVNLNSSGDVLIASHQDTENNTINANVYSYNTTNTSWESLLTKTLDNDVADNEIMPAFMNSGENKFLITNPSYSTASKTDVGRVNISTVHKDINYKNSTYELQTGKVGIGIETPTVAFDISGSVHIDNGNVLVTDISAGNSKLHVAGDLTTSVDLTSINTTALLYDNPVDFQNRLFVNSSDIQFAGGDNTRPSDLSVNTPVFTGSQLGDWWKGDTTYDYYGDQVAVNHDGSIIAFLASGQDDNGSASGTVYVYAWTVPGTSSGEWVQLGQDIQGANASRIQSMAMNKDGTVIATGEPDDSGNTSYGGSARVWVYNGTDTWIQVGEDIEGKASADYSGWKVSLNDDGTRIAIVSSGNDDNGNNTGHVRVWEYSNADMTSGGSWTQIGQNIVGIGTSNLEIDNVTLNGDGSIVVTVESEANNPDNSDNNEGLLRVWLYNGTDTWTQIGQNIYGEEADDEYGEFGAAINSTGDIIAAGSYRNDSQGYGSDNGMVSVWKYSLPGQTGGVWTQLGSTIYGNPDDNDAEFSGPLDLSDDGLTLAVSIGSYDGVTYQGGGVKIYKYDSNSSEWVEQGIIGGDLTGYYFSRHRMAMSGNVSVVIGGYYSYSTSSGNVAVYRMTEPTPQLNIGTLDTTFLHSLIVPGNLVIVDGSNNSSFGSYTTYSKENSLTELFHVGKSKSNVFNIVNSNNVGVFMNTGSTSFSSTSDESLKKDIQSLDKSTVDKLTQIESKRFDWKSSKKHDVGFIAQEVEELLPEIIEENTYNDGNTYKGIKTSSLLPLCLDKLKEIENRIDKL